MPYTTTIETPTVPSPAHPGPGRLLAALRRPGAVLTIILTCQLMVVLDATIVNIALPKIQGALGFSTSNLSWVINSYTLAFGGLLLLGARAGDILGRRRVFLAGISLFTVASLAGGLADNAAMLLAARATQGVGAAIASPAALALLMTMFPEGAARMRALAWYSAMSIGGAAIGLIAGGMLTQWLSWRWVLFVNVPIGIIVVLAGVVALSETARHTARFDVLGAVTSTGGMTALVYGFVRAASDGWGDLTTIAAFVGGIVLLGAFVAVEARSAAPITPLRLFTDRGRSSAYLARLLLVAGMMGMFFFLTQFLQDVLGYSALRSGFAFLPLSVALFAASQLAARKLIGRISERTLMLGGLTLSTLGLLWLTQLSETSNYADIALPLLMFGIGNGLAFLPLTSLALRGVTPADAGAGSGLVNVMQQLGGALGLAVLVTVYGTVQRNSLASAHSHSAEAVRHAFVAGADRAFWVAAAFLVVTLVVLALLPRRAQPAPEPDEAGSADATTLETA